MRFWRVVVALSLALAATVGVRAEDSVDAQLRLVARANGRPFIDYAPTKPGAPSLVSDAVPRVYIRFDDARIETYTYNQIQAFLRRGLPVTLNINSDTIGNASRMSWDQLRELQRFAWSRGTELHFQQHSNGNLSKLGDLSNEIGHAELVSELDPTKIVAETGYRPRFFVLPGDDGRQQWARRNREYLQSVCDSLGLWYMTAVVASDSSEVPNFNPSQLELDQFASAESNFKLDGSVLYYGKPGMGIPRNYIPNGITDLNGAVAVERVSSLSSDYQSSTPAPQTSRVKYGSWDVTGVDPPLHDAWSLASKGVDAAVGWYASTWAYHYSSRLANNYGFVVVLHDSTAVTTSAITGVTGSEIDGIWSPDHIAWTLAMLQEKGHIRVVGPEEFAEWVTGDWAPNTDLIANPYCLIPQFDIGDTLGWTSEYMWVRGFSSVGTQSPSQVNTQVWFRDMTLEQTGNIAKFDRTDADANPHDVIGPSVVGVNGRSGGIYSSASGGPNLLRIGQGNLPPGRYRFSFAYKASADPAIRELHLAYRLKGYKLASSIEAGGFSPAFNDTLLRWNWTDQDRTADLVGNELGRWADFSIPFDLPRYPIGSDSADPLGQVAEGAGASRLFRMFSAASVGDAGEFIPLVESGVWGFTFQLSTSGEAYISNPRLIYLGRR